MRTAFSIILVSIITLLLSNEVIAQSNQTVVDSLTLQCSKGDISACGMLRNIALTDTSASVRVAAAKTLTTQNGVIEVIRKSKYFAERRDLYKELYNKSEWNLAKIKDPFVLSDIAINDHDLLLCKEAIYIVSNQAIKKNADQLTKNLLIEMAYNESLPSPTRQLAIDYVYCPKYFKELVDIIEKNHEYDPRLAKFAAVNILSEDEFLNGYYEKLWIFPNIKIDYQSYDFGRLKRMRFDYDVSVRSDKQRMSMEWHAPLGEYIEELWDILQLHYGYIEIDKICEYLLRPFSIEELKEISNESDIFYLREVAKLILNGDMGPPLRPTKILGETDYDMLLNGICLFGYKLIKGENNYFIRLKLMLGEMIYSYFTMEAGETIFFELENGETVTLVNPQNEKTEIGEGAIGFGGSQAHGMELMLKIEDSDIEKLGSHKVQKLLIQTTNKLYEKNIKDGRSETFMEMINYIKGI